MPHRQKMPLDSRPATPDPARPARYAAIERRTGEGRRQQSDVLLRRARDEDPALRAAHFADIERRAGD